MNKILTVRYFYFLSVYLVMATIFGLSFTWSFPPGLVLAITAFVALLYKSCYSTKVGDTQKKCILLISLWYLYSVLISGSDIILQFFINLLNFIVIYSVISLPINNKTYLLHFITRATSILLCISLFFWFLFLIGIPLPNSGEMIHNDNYHSYVNYYFFIMSPKDFLILPRFFGMFKEPGHVASICVLLILANIDNVKKKLFDIIVFAISLILSFSLAGWVVMALAIFMLAMFKGKYKILGLVGVLIIFGTLYYVSQTNENSVVNEYIFDRLVYDESTGIVGNNRTDYNFESRFQNYIKTSYVWFGISSQLKQGYDWTVGCAGWKVTIVHSGIMGFALINIILLAIYLFYKSKHGFIFFISYLILCYIRAYYTNPYWLYIFLIALPYLHERTDINKLKNNKYEKKIKSTL